jgi:hypothetical protein
VRKKLVASLGRIGLISVVAVLGSLVAGGIWLIRDERRLNAKYPIKHNEAQPPPPAQWEWIHISAKELSDEYVVNSMAANHKYRGQHLAVTGTVERVLGRAGVRSFVLLFASGLETIQCQVRDSDESTAVSLRRGDRVEVLGLCNGNDSLNILLSDCAVTRQ